MYQKLTRVIQVAMVPLLVALVLLLFGLWRNEKTQAQQTAQNYKALNRSHKITMDQLGRKTAEVQAIEATAKELVQIEVTKSDSLARKLQAVVKSAKGRVTFAAVTQSVTTGRISGKTAIVTDSLQPIYSGVVSDPFTEIAVTAGPDSIHIDYKYTSQLHVWHAYRNPLIGKPSITTFIRDQNPNAMVTDAVTYVAPTPKPRRLGWFAGGVGAVVLLKIITNITAK